MKSQQLTGLALGVGVGIGIHFGLRALFETAFSTAVSDGNYAEADQVLRQVFFIEEWGPPLALVGLGLLLISDDGLGAAA